LSGSFGARRRVELLLRVLVLALRELLLVLMELLLVLRELLLVLRELLLVLMELILVLMELVLSAAVPMVFMLTALTLVGTESYDEFEFEFEFEFECDVPDLEDCDLITTRVMPCLMRLYFSLSWIHQIR
jgi:hypothetical protein